MHETLHVMEVTIITNSHALALMDIYVFSWLAENKINFSTKYTYVAQYEYFKYQQFCLSLAHNW